MSELVCRTLELLAETKGAFASAVKNIFNTRTMATLKISDLSVGDWVRWDAEYGKPQIVMVTEIHWNRIVGECKGIEYGMRLSNIHPIPITAEILEKNGLCVVEEDADFSEYELFGSENFSIFHTKGTLRYRLETPQASVVCCFVHELQHALRLAGVEKEINL